VALAGNLYEMLRDVRAIGDTGYWSGWSSDICAPYLLVDGLNIAVLTGLTFSGNMSPRRCSRSPEPASRRTVRLGLRYKPKPLVGGAGRGGRSAYRKIRRDIKGV